MDTCSNGHELTPENTHASPTGQRRCRRCGQERTALYRERLREKALRQETRRKVSGRRSGLTPEQVESIRRLHEAGGVSYKELGERFGVPTSTVGYHLRPYSYERHIKRFYRLTPK